MMGARQGLAGVLAVVVSCVPLLGAPLLSGRVVDAAGKGIAGVEARLAVLGLSVTTDSEGAFEIEGPTSVPPSSRLRSGPSRAFVRDGHLCVVAGARQTAVKAELYDLHGRTVTVVFDGVVEAGTLLERPLLRRDMRLAKGTYIARVEVNGQGGSRKMIHMGPFTPATRESSPGLGKVLAVLDTLCLTKSGCAQRRVVITAWAVDLGDIALGCDGVLPPELPKSYTLPSGATRVTNSAELLSALSAGSAKDIVLADGTYDNSTYFHPAAAHRLWAEGLGAVTLKAGVLFNKAPGNEVHGIRFDISENSKTFNSSIVSSANPGHFVTVEDCWFEGHGTSDRAILLRAINGIELHRLYIRNFQRDGIRITDYPTRGTPNPPPHLSDLDIANITSLDSACCHGTAEFGICLGNSAEGCTVERVKIRHCASGCISNNNACHHTLWRDLDIDWCGTGSGNGGSLGVGFYFEHRSDYNTIERFRMGPNLGLGIHWESGNQSRYGYYPSSTHTLIQDGYLETARVGVSITLCTDNVTVQRVTFKNQCFAAICNNAVAKGSDAAIQAYPYCDGSAGASNKFVDNDYSGIDATAVEISPAWSGTVKCQ